MVQIMLKRSLLVVAVTTALGLTACGGSSSDSDTDNPPNNPPADTSVTGVTLSGTVAKGIVNKGVVTAEELSASKTVLAVVGNATTAVDGTYSMTLSSSYKGGPVQITISTDANTEMKCDVPAGCGTRTDGLVDTTNPTGIDFGEWYKPAALAMTALIPNSVANATVSVNVTPFTHMAAVRAKAAVTFNAAAISNANSEVSILLGGIDVLNTAPVDITDPVAIADASATQTSYAALASAIANTGLVDKVNGQPDIEASIDLLASSFAAGTMVADDSAIGADDAAQISLQEIVTAASETLSETGTVDLAGVIVALQDDIDTAVTSGAPIDPVASATAGDTNLAKAKAMMSDVRTWGNVISLEIGNKGELFGTEVDLASNALDALDMTGRGAGDAFDNAINVVFQRVFEGVTSADLTTYVTDEYYIYSNTGAPTLVLETDFTAGTISLTGDTVTITGGEIYGHTVNLTMSIPQDGTNASVFTLGVQSASVVNAGAGTSMTVSSGSVVATLASAYTLDFAAMNAGTEAALPKITDMTIGVDIELTQSKGLNYMGQNVALDSPVTFAGTLELDLDPVIIKTDNVVTNGVAIDPNQGALPKSFTLTGNVSNATNSMDMSLVVNVSNTAAFQFVGDFAPVGTAYSSVAGRGKMATWTYSNGGNKFDFISPDYSLSLVLNLDGSIQVTQTMNYGGGYSDVNSYPVSGEYANTADYISQGGGLIIPSSIRTFIDGEGDYSADLSSAIYTSDGSVDGALQRPEFVVESADSWIDADIGLTFTAQLNGLPEARINITADRTDFKAGRVTTTVSYGSRQFAIEADVASSALDVVSVSGSVTITNQDNIKLTVVDDNIDDLTLPVATLSFNGVDYGTVTDSNGLLKVTYTDGTFEIF